MTVTAMNDAGDDNTLSSAADVAEDPFVPGAAVDVCCSLMLVDGRTGARLPTI